MSCPIRGQGAADGLGQLASFRRRYTAPGSLPGAFSLPRSVPYTPFGFPDCCAIIPFFMHLSAVTIFLSAFLLFQIQPMIAKMILPWFGGSAAVWITAMLFFQTVLLGGYLYAHWLVRSLRPRMQAIVHVVLLLSSMALLPIAPAAAWKPSGSEEPITRILGLLTVSVGLPYFLLSTTSPLIQA